MFTDSIPKGHPTIKKHLPQMIGSVLAENAHEQYFDMRMDPYILDGVMRINYDESTTWTRFSFETNQDVVTNLRPPQEIPKPLLTERTRAAVIGAYVRNEEIYAPQILIIEPLAP